MRMSDPISRSGRPARTSVAAVRHPARRSFVQGLLALAATATAAPRWAVAQDNPEAAPAGQAFSAEWLKDYARGLAGVSYKAPPEVGEPFKGLDDDTYRKIRFRPEEALWRDQDSLFRLRFFHPGRYFLHPVTIYEVVDGRAHEVRFSKDMFDYGDSGLKEPASDSLGFAGFRVHYHLDFDKDMAAFLGASYFRAVGKELQYGISARGLAINTALPSQEEFPFFKTFWIERPGPGQTALTVHALLESPSMTGAYTFVLHPDATTVMDVTATLHCRKAVERLGIAPLTSMYHHGENDRREIHDFRPEVHDSDGLAILRGNGERVWRPLVNPRDLRVNAFGDENPRGFGLLQRDRDFASYQDDGVYYDRRPNLWIEPRGDWGRGVVHLVEIPTDEEIFDNIVAFWTPEKKPAPGDAIALAYRLYWGTRVPDIDMQVAHVAATRLGIGGIPGQTKDRDTHKFVIDFAGGTLGMLPGDAPVEPVITTSRGEILKPAARPIKELGGWRVNFDLRPDGKDPIDLRCYLRLRGDALSETWIYQWAPPA